VFRAGIRPSYCLGVYSASRRIIHAAVGFLPGRASFAFLDATLLHILIP
jgi:hypothetical protein